MNIKVIEVDGSLYYYHTEKGTMYFDYLGQLEIDSACYSVAYSGRMTEKKAIQLIKDRLKEYELEIGY